MVYSLFGIYVNPQTEIECCILINVAWLFIVFIVLYLFILFFFVIYRDFALRNCLVSSDLTVKVGDYGLAEEIFKVKFWNCSFDSDCDIVSVEKLIFFFLLG